jgi:hypothetical protein
MNLLKKETILSLQNSKSVDYKKFKAYLVEKDKLNKEQLIFTNKIHGKKWSFDIYI